MRVSYSPDYLVPLPDGHPFPMGKFPALYRILLAHGLITPEDVVSPTEASWGVLTLVHTADYLGGLARGTLGRSALRRLGLPWSPALVRRSRLAVQGTLNAAWMALEDGIAANLAGGTHHAFPGHGEGFCVLNDVGVAVRALRRGGWIRRALVVDLDVHQGNGTAAVFAGDGEVTTYSLHGANNYPYRKVPSTVDVPLADGTADEQYLSRLRQTLPAVVASARPDLIFYLAGVDVLADDRYGRLALTEQGLARRDRFVLSLATAAEIPVTLLLSGGYAETPEKTAALHAVAHRVAAEVTGRPPAIPISEVPTTA